MKLFTKFLGYIFLAAIISFYLSASAQTFRGGIHGSVSDPRGALVTAAEVVATNTATGQSYSTLSSKAGEFSFTDLPLGQYSVTIRKDGFSPAVTERIPVEAGAIYTLTARLVITGNKEAIVVTANPVSVDTSTTVQSSVLDSVAVEGVPLNGRDFTQLLALTPGYSGYTVGFLGTVDGTQATQINWQIEGADNNDLWNNTSAVNQGGVYGVPGVLLPLDSVEQFSVVTQGNAEAGRNPGGIANLLLKSGTNTLHGSLYY